MEEALKSLVGFAGLFASISLAPIHELVAFLLGLASLIFMIVSILDKIIDIKKKWGDGR